MYKRDFLILALAVFSVYFALQNEGPFTFKKAWYYRLSGENVNPFMEPEVLPKPVVLDLNGDGSLETVLVTHDQRLVVLRGRGVGRDGDGFAVAQHMAEISLRPTGFHTPSGQRPVGLAAGYLEKASEDLVHSQRKAVIVVVTENWHVTCFNHNLVKLWSYDIHEEMHSHVTIHELAILITHHSIHERDRGLIVVGGSMNIVSSMEEDVVDDSDFFETERETEEKEAKMRHRLGDDEKESEMTEGQKYGADVSRVFSYFAFNGGSGEKRWTQTGTEFKHDLHSLKEGLMPQSLYKMEAEHLSSMDYSQASCRDYRESILHNLPHQWLHRVDTQLHLSHFAKHKRGKGERKKHLANSQKRPTSKSSCTGSQCKPDAVAKVIGHVSKKATSDGRKTPPKTLPPNAIVAHLKEGVEAIHLYTGRSICKLHLPQGGLHVDLNGDGVPDHIQVAMGQEGEHAAHRHHRVPGCFAYATSGVPPKEPYFNGSICGNTWGDPLSHVGMFGDSSSEHQRLEVAPPAFLPIPTPRGELAFRYGQRGMALFLNSNGEVTAINSRGKRKWSVATDCMWNSEKATYQRSEPTLKALPLRVHALPTAILVSGGHAAAVLSEHGNVLTSFNLPDSPLLPLEIVDLNGDGLNDILLISRHMVYGYIQVQNLGGRPFGMLVLCLIVAMGTIYASQHTGSESTTKIKRSTDRTD